MGSDAEANELQQMVREGFARYGRDSYTFERRREILGTPEGYSTEAWNEYAELGWLALCLPEALGGLQADAGMTGALMETVGRHLLMEPLLVSAVLGTAAILRTGDEALLAELAPGLADGSCKLAIACQGTPVRLREGVLAGESVNVLHGDVADFLLVGCEDADGAAALCLVDASSTGLSRRAYRLVDGRGAAILSFDGAPARVLGDAAALERLRDESAVALCAEALGSVERLIEATADYLQVRKQFGRAIGTYQALQHRMSEMYLLREEIRALTAAARVSLDASGPERQRSIGGAVAYVLRAAREAGNAAVQLHGGVGVTEELEISHHFRRLMVNAALQGGFDPNFERFARGSEALSRNAAGGH